MGCGSSKTEPTASPREDVKPQKGPTPADVRQPAGVPSAETVPSPSPAAAASSPPPPQQTLAAAAPAAAATEDLPVNGAVSNGSEEATQPKLRAAIMGMTEDSPGDSGHEEQEEAHDIGELPVIQKKKKSSIRRATPQVQSMADSMKRSSREKVAPSSRSSSVAESICE